jgi:hypothetical protein
VMALEEAFHLFCGAGGRSPAAQRLRQRSVGMRTHAFPVSKPAEMSRRELVRLARDCGLVEAWSAVGYGGRRVPQTEAEADIDLIFTSLVGRSKRGLDFEQFQHALELLALRWLGPDANDQDVADACSEMVQLILHCAELSHDERHTQRTAIRSGAHRKKVQQELASQGLRCHERARVLLDPTATASEVARLTAADFRAYGIDVAQREPGEPLADHQRGGAGATAARAAIGQLLAKARASEGKLEREVCRAARLSPASLSRLRAALRQPPPRPHPRRGGGGDVPAPAAGGAHLLLALLRGAAGPSEGMRVSVEGRGGLGRGLGLGLGITERKRLIDAIDARKHELSDVTAALQLALAAMDKYEKQQLATTVSTGRAELDAAVAADGRGAATGERVAPALALTNRLGSVDLEPEPEKDPEPAEPELELKPEPELELKPEPEPEPEPPQGRQHMQDSADDNLLSPELEVEEPPPRQPPRWSGSQGQGGGARTVVAHGRAAGADWPPGRRQLQRDEEQRREQRRLHERRLHAAQARSSERARQAVMLQTAQEIHRGITHQQQIVNLAQQQQLTRQLTRREHWHRAVTQEIAQAVNREKSSPSQQPHRSLELIAASAAAAAAAATTRQLGSSPRAAEIYARAHAAALADVMAAADGAPPPPPQSSAPPRTLPPPPPPPPLPSRRRSSDGSRAAASAASGLEGQARMAITRHHRRSSSSAPPPRLGAGGGTKQLSSQPPAVEASHRASANADVTSAGYSAWPRRCDQRRRQN